MEKWGATLLGIGILSYVAPLFGIQFQLVNLLGDTPGARIGMIVVGGVLLFLGRISGLGNSGSTEVANSDVPQLVPPTPRRRPASGVSASTAGSHFCPTCASPVGGQDKFCGKCGKTLVHSGTARHCTTCGESIPDGKRFCTRCGTGIV